MREWCQDSGLLDEDEEWLWCFGCCCCDFVADVVELNKMTTEWWRREDMGKLGFLFFFFLFFTFFSVFFFQDMKEGIRSNFLKKIKIKTREDERDRKGLDLLICSNLLEIYEDLVEILWRYGRDVWRSGRDLWRLNKDCVIGAMKKRKRGKIGVFQFDFLFFFPLFFPFQIWDFRLDDFFFGSDLNISFFLLKKNLN